MWDNYSEDRSHRVGLRRLLRLAVIIAICSLIFAMVSSQALNLAMNVEEFGVLYLKPLWLLSVSGLLLASIALVRLNVSKRQSLTWYVISIAVSLARRNDFEKTRHLKYSDYAMTRTNFAAWQVTKIILFAPLFSNAAFGMAVEAASQGSVMHLSSLAPVLSLPFVNLQEGSAIGRSIVAPAIIPLTIVLPAVFSAIGVRLLVYVGLGGATDLFSRYLSDSASGKPRYLSYISKIELIAGVTFLWIAANIVFASNIDASTRFVISSFVALGIAFIFFGALDAKRARVIIYPEKRQLYARFVTAIAITAAAGIIVVINDSFLSANSSLLRAPYEEQEIAINRYLAELDSISAIPVHLDASQQPSSYLADANATRASVLDKMVVWDKEAITSRLKMSVGQSPSLALIDADLVKLNDSLYWAGITMPVRPSDSSQPGGWYNDHLILTHSDAGIPLVSATSANGSESDAPVQLSTQKQTYYGPSGDLGIFSKTWSAYPLAQAENAQYSVNGGVMLSPPLTWIFDPNFLLSYPGQAVEITRYKDVFQRMDVLFPYFIYDFQIGDTLSSQFKKIDITPVTDGSRSYWLVPLILPIDTSHVPWASSFALRFVGYGLVDAYDGSVKIYVTGHDEFSDLFYKTYRDTGYVQQSVPDWLSKQLRYPSEMFYWRIGKYDTFHVTRAQDFFDSKLFYDVPKGAGGIEGPSYYFMDLSPGRNSTKFEGVQLVQLRNSPGAGILGYATVSNERDSLGSITFYSVSNGTSSSNVTLISPDSAREILGKDKDFQSFKSQLPGSTRVGDATLYKLANIYEYTVPIYTIGRDSGSSQQLSGIAIVSAPASQAGNVVGVGPSPREALDNFLGKTTIVSGNTTTELKPPLNNASAIETRVNAVEQLFVAKNITLVKPTAIVSPAQFQEARVTYDANTTSEVKSLDSAVSSFISNFALAKRVYEWRTGDNVVNFGVIKEIQGVSEIHYLTVDFGR